MARAGVRCPARARESEPAILPHHRPPSGPVTPGSRRPGPGGHGVMSAPRPARVGATRWGRARTGRTRGVAQGTPPARVTGVVKQVGRRNVQAAHCESSRNAPLSRRCPGRWVDGRTGGDADAAPHAGHGGDQAPAGLPAHSRRRAAGRRSGHGGRSATRWESTSACGPAGTAAREAGQTGRPRLATPSPARTTSWPTCVPSAHRPCPPPALLQSPARPDEPRSQPLADLLSRQSPTTNHGRSHRTGVRQG